MANKRARRIRLIEIEWATVSVRTIQIVLFILFGVGFFIVYWYFLRQEVDIPRIANFASESAARFIDYEGKVEVKPRDEFVWKVASFKMELREGDRIRTSPDSSARIKFDDGTEITVQTDSLVVISKQEATDQKDDQVLAVIENGESDINAKRSVNPASVSTTRISQFRLAPGSKGTVIANEGEHTTVVDSGFGVVQYQGKTTQLSSLEQLKVGRDASATKTKLPLVPPLQSPPQGQIFEFLSDQGLSIDLRWRDVSDAVKYHVQISESPLFAKLSAENANLSRSSITIKIPKTHKKQYFWRVRSIDAARNNSPWSEPFQFVVYTPTTSKVTESLDKTPPALNITYMHPFLPYVQVEGQTEPDVFLTLNGQIIDVKDDGKFVYTYTLQSSGWNELKFVAEDPAGNKTTMVKRVEYR